jgi:hypothetical protein
MSPTAVFAAVAFAALQLFAAGLALQSALSESMSASAGAAAERVAHHAPAHR